MESTYVIRVSPPVLDQSDITCRPRPTETANGLTPMSPRWAAVRALLARLIQSMDLTLLPTLDVKTLVFVLAGALIGVVVASLVVPPALAWYTAPGGLPQGAQIQALVQIPDVIRYSTGRLMRGQLIGGVIGAIVGLILGLLTNARGRATVPQHGSSGLPESR